MFFPRRFVFIYFFQRCYASGQSAPPLTFTRVTNVCAVQVPVEGEGGGGDMMDMYCVVTANRRKIAARIAGILHGLFAIAFTLKPPVSAYVFLAG